VDEVPETWELRTDCEGGGARHDAVRRQYELGLLRPRGQHANGEAGYRHLLGRRNVDDRNSGLRLLSRRSRPRDYPCGQSAQASHWPRTWWIVIRKELPFKIQSANNLAQSAGNWTPCPVGWHTDFAISCNRPVFFVTCDRRCLAEVLPISIASLEAGLKSASTRSMAVQGFHACTFLGARFDIVRIVKSVKPGGAHIRVIRGGRRQ